MFMITNVTKFFSCNNAKTGKCKPVNKVQGKHSAYHIITRFPTHQSSRSALALGILHQNYQRKHSSLQHVPGSEHTLYKSVLYKGKENQHSITNLFIRVFTNFTRVRPRHQSVFQVLAWINQRH